MNGIIGKACPTCGRDNSDHANVCTSEFCPSAKNNSNRERLTELGEIDYEIRNLSLKVLAIAEKVARDGGSQQGAVYR